jgi:hypothetical protein
MSHYPVESGEQLFQAVNYLLSGPGGLGQNFQGFSTYAPGWLTGNFRQPFSSTTQANLYVAPIAINTAEMLDGRTWKYTFASAQPSAPFSPGQGITVSGVTNSYYDGTFNPIGVAECTTTYVIARTDGTYALVAPSSGGTVEYFNTYAAGPTPGETYPIGTDCNAKVLVNSGTDRVFISGQLLNTISYTASTSSDLQYTVQVSRYLGFINSDPVNPEYRFDFDQIIAQRVYSGGVLNSLSGTGTLDPIETVFTAILDQPSTGYYWYFIEVEFAVTNGGDLQVTESQTGNRSFSSQVVKQ